MNVQELTLEGSLLGFEQKDGRVRLLGAFSSINLPSSWAPLQSEGSLCMQPSTVAPQQSSFYLVRLNELSFRTAYYDVTARRWDSGSLPEFFYWSSLPEVVSNG